jgi:SpoIID/LytB domain protein
MTVRRCVAVLAAVVGSVAAALTVAPAPAAIAGGVSVDEVYPVPANGIFTLAGHGYGHGHGMSQFGAYGAALDGLDVTKILAFYYPNTTLQAQPTKTTARVLIHAALGHPVTVQPRSGAKLVAYSTVTGVAPCTLPTAINGGQTPITGWRARVVSTTNGGRVRLQRTLDGSTWRGAAPAGCADAWSQPMDGSIVFADGGIVRLVLPWGSVVRYRGRMSATFTGSGLYPVNVVPVESYLRSVVPSEMPSSWSAAALQAQAVAARTYAMYGVAHHSTGYFDLYDDTRSQMYTGVAHEVSSTDAAIKATAGDVLVDSDNRPIFAEFGSSSGGWTADGGEPYLTAHRDPYDGVPKLSWNPHSWRTTVTAASIASAFPSVGQVESLIVTGRDGNGAWGGRVTAMTVHGSSGDVAISGVTFRGALGLRSEWFRVVLPPDAPTYVRAVRTGTTAAVTWQPPAANGGAAVTGYGVTLSPGGATKSVGSSARSATFSGLTAGTDYTATVVANSKSGPSYGSTVTMKVARLGSSDAVATAVAVSAATFADGTAKSVVLVATGHRASAVGVGPLAAAFHGPVLVTAPTALPTATKTEIERVLPSNGTIYLMGGGSSISSGIASGLRADGFRTARIAGSTAAATAAKTADAVAAATKVAAVYEVAGRRYRDAWAATPAAIAAHAVVLVTNGTSQAPETASWIAAHPGLPRYAVGTDAQQADPGATAVGGSGSLSTSLAIARTFTSPRRVAVVSTGGVGTLAEAVRLRSAGPLLYVAKGVVSVGARRYLSNHNGDIRMVELVGGGLPYYDVESEVQASLLG